MTKRLVVNHFSCMQELRRFEPSCAYFLYRNHLIFLDRDYNGMTMGRDCWPRQTNELKFFIRKKSSSKFWKLQDTIRKDLDWKKLLALIWLRTGVFLLLIQSETREMLRNGFSFIPSSISSISSWSCCARSTDFIGFFYACHIGNHSSGFRYVRDMKANGKSTSLNHQSK